ncbi:hypothetical protein DD238_007264 [Peronospora effusa]|uniref:Uncharacterized protein n=1 Tax=Peronospora effusa TaxID=542832 RepID=A0A3M6VFX1_9STRA|nr:hypothetical protein DD238_007264 [Peronospora effusa]
MLGFQYVVAKSRELSSVLDRELSAASNRSISFRSISGNSSVEIAASNGVPVTAEASTPSSLSVHTEGHTFLRAQQKLHAQSMAKHQKLMQSGQELDAALAHARFALQTQVSSEQFLAQNFHLVSKVRQQLAGVRKLVLRVAGEAEQVESLLVQHCEENAAKQNADFAVKQQQELENFEARIAKESEGRKRDLLEMKQQKLASVFMNDLRTYQTLVARAADAAATEATVVKDEKDEKEKVTLDDVDLVVTADSAQLDAFYDSASEEEKDLQNSNFLTPSVPKELLEEEEEKSEENELEIQNEKAAEGETTPEAVDTLMDQKDDAMVKVAEALKTTKAEEENGRTDEGVAKEH